MQRYSKAGFGIEVVLKNTAFIARANILREDTDDKETYDVTLEIRKKDISFWDMMDEQHYRMHSKNINSDVYEMIIAKFKNGFFNYYMNRYEYDMTCMDYGDEHYREKKELFWSDDPKYKRPLCKKAEAEGE